MELDAFSGAGKVVLISVWSSSVKLNQAATWPRYAISQSEAQLALIISHSLTTFFTPEIQISVKLWLPFVFSFLF